MTKKQRSVITLIGTGFLLISIGMYITTSNIIEEVNAELISKEELSKVQYMIPTLSEKDNIESKYNVKYSDEMPFIEVDGLKYIGIVNVPKLELSLPVQIDWDYDKLKQTPNLYKGNVYDDSMIIMAHSYRRHFGYISQLVPGDEITFTNVNGMVYRYAVTQILKIEGTDIDSMVQTDADITLFTCDYGGQNRVTIRGTRIN